VETSKLWYNSVGLQGSIIALIGLIFGVLNLVFKVEIANSNEISQAVAGAFSLVGIVMTWIGRARATQKIGFSRTK